MRAEWEPHAATWLAWPHHKTDFPSKLGAMRLAFAEAIRLLCTSERVRLLVESKAERRQAERTLKRAGASLEQVDFVQARTNRSWTRDYLPLFVRAGSTKKPSVVAVKWRFNGWARYRDHALDEKAGVLVAKREGRIVRRPHALGSDLVLEGGAIDVDGRGTLLTTEDCLLAGKRARMAALGREGIEQIFAETLGIKRVIWLPSGIAGDDTSGHVDDFARFVAPGHVVVCHETNRRDENYAPLRAAASVLKKAIDARGKRLLVSELPMPRPLYFDGQRLPASYANFYIANTRVLVPTFNDPNDRVALNTLADIFKHREVVGVHAVDWILGLGSLHCSTMQEPRA
jgi:agmatine deiminase